MGLAQARPNYIRVISIFLNDLEGSLSNVCYILCQKQDRKNILKMNKEVGMLLPKKRANTSGVGKINNYCEDIYTSTPTNHTYTW